ncbi:hypothetical protein KA025_00625 [Candidatus Saccharibacteria bacterium]|jgi:uncharacterized protein HemX|nr:hypothetical protein [Candidatus Saccharibacteria bacterium]MBP7834570.1 hypothetical protein [Candidatus Saccharibacteria bacterium]
MNSFNNQKGFSVLVTLLVVVVIGAVGFAGWQVYSKQQTNKDSVTQTQTPSNASPTLNSAQDVDKAQKNLDNANINSDLDSSSIDNDLNSIL